MNQSVPPVSARAECVRSGQRRHRPPRRTANMVYRMSALRDDAVLSCRGTCMHVRYIRWRHRAALFARPFSPQVWCRLGQLMLERYVFCEPTRTLPRVAMGVFTLAAVLLAGATYDSWGAGHTEPEVDSKPSSRSKQNTEDDSKPSSGLENQQPKNLEARKHNATSSPLDPTSSAYRAIPVVFSSSMDARPSSPPLTLDVRAHTVTHTAHESQGGGSITTDD